MTKPDPESPLVGRPAWSSATAFLLCLVAAVAAVAWVSLLLAELGRHELLPAIALGGAILLFGAAWTRRGLADRREAAHAEQTARSRRWLPFLLLVLVLAFAAWMFFPGFPFALADRDPGVYLAQAEIAARTGGLVLDDPVVDPGSGLAWVDASGWRQGETRFPGFWVQSRDEHRVAPQFYALYPALLATAISVAGREAAVAVNPALATLCVGLLFLIVRSAAGTLAALLAALLFGAQMMEVWQAKYPTAEIPAQLFLLGATLALLAALERRSAALGALAGFLTAAIFLARPDGLAFVAAAVAVALCAICVRGAGGVTRGYLLGLLPPFAHALVQAYHPRLTLEYTLRSGLPGPAWIALALATGALALAIAPRLRPYLRAWFDRFPRLERSLSRLAVVTFTLVLAIGYARPWLTGPHHAPDGTRTFNEASLYRLTWFFTPRGMVLLWVGFVLVAVTSLRRRPAILLLLSPFVVSLPALLYDPRVDAGLMWWTRRFVPYTLPGMVALVAIGAAGLVALAMPATGARRTAGAVRSGLARPWLALLAAVVALEIAITWLGMSLPLRRHREMQGTYELIDELGELVPGERSVLLWHSSRDSHSPGYCFGGPVWAIHDQVSAFLPWDATAAEVLDWASAYPEQPLFLVADDAVPPALASLPFVRFRDFRVSFPMWEESSERRPEKPRLRWFVFTVWRLERERAGGGERPTAPPDQAEPAPRPERARQSSRSGATTDSRTTPVDILERPTRRSR